MCRRKTLGHEPLVFGTAKKTVPCTMLRGELQEVYPVGLVGIRTHKTASLESGVEWGFMVDVGCPAQTMGARVRNCFIVYTALKKN